MVSLRLSACQVPSYLEGGLLTYREGFHRAAPAGGREAADRRGGRSYIPHGFH